MISDALSLNIKLLPFQVQVLMGKTQLLLLDLEFWFAKGSALSREPQLLLPDCIVGLEVRLVLSLSSSRFSAIVLLCLLSKVVFGKMFQVEMRGLMI